MLMNADTLNRKLNKVSFLVRYIYFVYGHPIL